MPYFFASFGYSQGDRPVDGHAVALRIGGVVGQRAQREGEFVQRMRFADQVQDKISGAHVMHQVAEELAAERVVAHVLDDAARVGVGVRLQQIFGSGLGIALQQEGPDVAIPGGIDDRLVGENRIGLETGARRAGTQPDVRTNRHTGSIIAMRWPFRRAPHHSRSGM